MASTGVPRTAIDCWLSSARGKVGRQFLQTLVLGDAMAGPHPVSCALIHAAT